MTEEIFFQHWIFTNFVLPFLLIFFIVFGILEKTKFFDRGKQLNALISFVVGLIFVASVSPKLVVSNLILFLTVGLVVLFVTLLLWGFISGEDGLKFSNAPKPIKWIAGVVVLVFVFFAVIYSLGSEKSFFSGISNLFFQQSWSGNFWTNIVFILVVIVSLVLVLKPVASAAKSK